MPVSTTTSAPISDLFREHLERVRALQVELIQRDAPWSVRQSLLDAEASLSKALRYLGVADPAGVPPLPDVVASWHSDVL